ncbi:MAG: DUF1540 domain-containing protein [Planctomycetota bacterium]|jgi:hypothetical protein
MKMPSVSKCEVIRCAYNMGHLCRAMAITIGDIRSRRCNTFCEFMMDVKGGDASIIASVGACKCSACIYNVSLECQGPEIRVGYKNNEAQCLSFQSSSVRSSIAGEVHSGKSNSHQACLSPEIFIG